MYHLFMAFVQLGAVALITFFACAMAFVYGRLALGYYRVFSLSANRAETCTARAFAFSELLRQPVGPFRESSVLDDAKQRLHNERSEADEHRREAEATSRHLLGRLLLTMLCIGLSLAGMSMTRSRFGLLLTEIETVRYEMSSSHTPAPYVHFREEGWRPSRTSYESYSVPSVVYDYSPEAMDAGTPPASSDSSF